MGKHPKTAKQRSIDIFDSISDSKLQVLQAAHASNFNYHWFSSETERYIKSITDHHFSQMTIFAEFTREIRMLN